jgi:hypothetical protein
MLPLAIALADDAVVIIIIVVVVAAGGLIYWLTDDTYRLTLTPSATTMTHNGQVTVVVDFQIRTWRFGSWASTPGNITTRVNALTAVLAPSPQSGATTAAAPTLNITVTGTNPGSDTLSVTATSSGGSATATGSIPMTVTPG